MAIMSEPPLKVVAWETTRRCVLACRHCRGAARDRDYAGELSTREGKRLLESIAAFARPIVILTGGEPMTRTDIYELAACGTDLGLRVVMAPCGHLIDPNTARRLKESGVRRISVSLDGADAETHDAFRGVEGAFQAAMEGIRHARAAGLEFQVNTTVTRLNVEQLPDILELAVEVGAAALDVFFLVPTGRGAALKDLEVPAEGYEQALEWIWEASRTAPIFVKPTCAPHYARLVLQRGGKPGRGSGGCMAGRGFVFVSHRGVVQPCGFLDIACGDLREADFDFEMLYRTADVFADLRRVDGYGGKCGICEYRRACGGCRARAYAHTGDYLAAEPSCTYVPNARKQPV